MPPFMVRCLGLLLLALHVHSVYAGDVVRVATSKNILSFPVVVAHEKGFFARHGVSVDRQDCVSGARCMVEMFEGRVDLATAADLPIALNGLRRNDFAILATFVTSNRDLKILVDSNAGISSLKDLVNTRVAYVRGTASQYFLDTMLIYNGIDPNRVERVPLGVEEASAALRDGRVQAVSLWEPHISRLRLAKGEQVRLLSTQRVYLETFNLLAPRDFIERHAEQIPAILRAIDEAIQFINTNPREALALLAQRLDVPVAVLSDIFGDYHYRLSLSKSLPRTLDSQVRWAIASGEVSAGVTPPNFLKFIEPRFLRLVRPSAVTLP